MPWCVFVRVLIAQQCAKSADVHEKVLLPAFTRSLLDPFPPGRIAALMSLTVTMEYYNAPDIARRLLPSVGMCAVDPGFFFVHYNAPDIARRLLPRLWVFCAVDAGFFGGGRRLPLPQLPGREHISHTCCFVSCAVDEPVFDLSFE